MNKKLFSIFLTMFLVGILSVSCSNANKTGSDSSSNAKVDSIYAGDWWEGTELVMKIDGNGNISFPGIEAQGAAIKGIEGSGSSYTVTYSGPDAPDVLIKITFTSNSSCSIIITQDTKTTTYNLIKKQ